MKLCINFIIIIIIIIYIYRWSPDGKYLSFIKFNDTAVPEYDIPVYLDDNFDGIPYNEKKVIKYPKVSIYNNSNFLFKNIIKCFIII